MSLFSFFLKVHGIIRRSSSFNTGRISHLYANTKTHTMGGGYIYQTIRSAFQANFYKKHSKLISVMWNGTNLEPPNLLTSETLKKINNIMSL